MSKVIIFSKYFPSYHPKAGKPTYFVEQIYNSIYPMRYLLLGSNNIHLGKKHHTIRKGNRWKVGDKFSPRVWSDKPYQSKQIIITDDIEITQIYNFRKGISDKWYINDIEISSYQRAVLAENDGLLYEDLKRWFNKPFQGQIICWANDDDVYY